jgi:uncharacterized protein (TIGR00730 family)
VRRQYGTGDKKLDQLIHWFIQRAGGSPNEDLLREFIVTVFKIREGNLDRGDIKLLNTAFKELRYALKVFYPYRHMRKVAIFGSARTPKSTDQYRQARDFAREIVRGGWMVITGASTGIMNAGNEGAGRESSFGVNIRLPFEQDANPVIADDPKLVNFKYFFTRKLIFMRESDAVVLCPGGFGTHDEGYEALTLIQTGKMEPRPVVCLDPPGSRYWDSWRDWVRRNLVRTGMIDPNDVNLIDFTHSARRAAEIVTRFYRNFHSMRYIGGLLVIRIRKPLSGRELAGLNAEFEDILKTGKIRQFDEPFKEELDEKPEILDLTRLALHFNRRHFSRLKQLVEKINEA